jgi:hypothetical protein
MTIGYSCTRVLRHDGDSASVATLGTTHHHPVIKWYILWTHKQPIGGTGILDHPPHPVGACVPLRTRPRLAAAKRGLSCWENKDEAWFFLIDVEREAIRPYRSLSLSCGTVLGSPQQRPCPLARRRRCRRDAHASTAPPMRRAWTVTASSGNRKEKSSAHARRYRGVGGIRHRRIRSAWCGDIVYRHIALRDFAVHSVQPAAPWGDAGGRPAGRGFQFSTPSGRWALDTQGMSGGRARCGISGCWINLSIWYDTIYDIWWWSRSKCASCVVSNRRAENLHPLARGRRRRTERMEGKAAFASSLVEVRCLASCVLVDTGREFFAPAHDLRTVWEGSVWLPRTGRGRSIWLVLARYRYGFI